MSLFTNLMKRYERISAKQFIIAGVFSLAFAASVGLGLANNGNIGAAVIRDNDPENSIDGCANNGGIGAADANELIKDVRDAAAGKCKTPKGSNFTDLPTIYAHFGLTADKYDQFAAEAKDGDVMRNGDVVVDGKVVMSGVWTMGRTTLNGKQREPITIGGKTYYHSPPSASFASSRQSLPALVWFDENGEAKTVILKPCGNSVGGGKKVTNKVTCDGLNSTQPDKENKPNTYKFTANATVAGNATISRVVYTITEGNTVVETVTKSNLTDAVEHTFKKDGKVTVTVYAKVPGGKEIQAAVVTKCAKEIKYVPPFFVCSSLLAAPIDQQKRSFRFTVQVEHDKNTSVKDVDFTLDGKSTTTGVTTKDKDDNIYKEYSFTDEVEHTVVAKVNFTTVDGVTSITCQAKVTPSKLPKCEVPGFENLPPNDERCGYCKPGIPKGDDRCKEVLSATTELPHTGAGSTIGLFAGTVIVGAFAHRLVTKRRASKSVL